MAGYPRDGYIRFKPPKDQMPDDNTTFEFVQYVVEQTENLINNPSIVIPVTDEHFILFDNDYVADLLSDLPEIAAQPGVTHLNQPVEVEYAYDSTSEEFKMFINLANLSRFVGDMDESTLIEQINSLAIEGYPVTVYDPIVNRMVDIREHTDLASFQPDYSEDIVTLAPGLAL